MGYPKLIPGDGSCLRTGFGGLSASSTTWLGAIAQHLATEMNNAAADARAKGIDVKFGNPIAAFDGKGICGNPEDIHGIVLDKTKSDDQIADFPVFNSVADPSTQSFHPKVAGATLYAGVMDNTTPGWAF